MTEKMTNHDFQTKVYDVDEKKGIISCAVNQIGVLDVQGDMSMPGSFTKTLQENMSRNAKSFVEGADHGEAQWTLVIENLRYLARTTNECS